MKWLDRTASFTAGLRVNPDLELAAEISMRDEKDIAEITDSLRWFAGVIATQERTALSLEDLNYKVEGKHISLSLAVPEQQTAGRVATAQSARAAHAQPGAAAGHRQRTAGAALGDHPRAILARRYGHRAVAGGQVGIIARFPAVLGRR